MDALEQYMQERGIGLPELASLTGVNHSTLWRRVIRKQTLRYATAKKVQAALRYELTLEQIMAYQPGKGVST